MSVTLGFTGGSCALADVNVTSINSPVIANSRIMRKWFVGINSFPESVCVKMTS